MNILFWNTGLTGKRMTNANAIDSCLQEIIVENDIDLLVLAEYSNAIEELCCQQTAQFLPLFNNSGYIKAIIKQKYATETLLDQSRYLITK